MRDEREGDRRSGAEELYSERVASSGGDAQGLGGT